MKRLNKFKGMYALLVAVAAVIGITIYGSCSADDDYDNYSSGNELFTLADGEMSLRSDVGGGNGTVFFYGFFIDTAGIALYDHALFVSGYHANITIQWTRGWTGNLDNPRCQPSAQVTSIHEAGSECMTTDLCYDDFPYHYEISFSSCDASCEWKPDDKLHIELVFTGQIKCYYQNYNNDYSNITPLLDYHGTKKFELTLTYQELLSYCVDF